jgi:large subunit ribosomal protein L16
MLTPRKQKFRRLHRGRSATKGVATRGTAVSFGAFGLKAQSAGEINSRQIEAARRTMTRYVKRGGKIWIRIFPHKVITRKASEVPMGSGKGSPEFFVSTIRPGRMLFEMDGVPADVAKEAMRRAAHKLPVKCKFINTQEQ